MGWRKWLQSSRCCWRYWEGYATRHKPCVGWGAHDHRNLLVHVVNVVCQPGCHAGAWLHDHARVRRDEFFNEVPHTFSQCGFDRIKPSVEKHFVDRTVVVLLVMAWSPIQRFDAGSFGVDHPGDYATLNSNHSRDGTSQLAIPSQSFAAKVSRISAMNGGRCYPPRGAERALGCE
jgi:hypothetical protein